jgi:penicillin-binding protein 2
MLIFDQLRKNDPQLRLLTFVVLGGMAVLLSGLWWVQVVSARDYQQNLVTQSYRTVRFPAVRGKILDRNGVALARNQPSYDMSLYLEDLRDEFKEEYAHLRPTRVATNSLPIWKRWLGVTAVRTQYVQLSKVQREALEWQARYDVAGRILQQVSQRLQSPLSFDFGRFKTHYTTRLALPYPMAQHLNPVQLARLEEQSGGVPGMDLEIESTRAYPYQTTAAHLLGYLVRDDRSIEGEDAFFSYRLPDYRGAVGIEDGYDKQLHGRAGEKSVLVNNLGYRQTENVWSPVEPGRDVVLTIDLGIQQAAERALPVFGPTTRGAAVVMDVHSGDILALASSPTFNPNAYIPSLSPTENQWLNDPKLRPQINRATQENYAPGSIFKTIIGLACLEAGLDPKASIYNPGFIYVGRRPIHDLAAPGTYDFRRGIMFSSNTYFITNGMKAGIEAIVKLGKRLHLGERIGLPTRQETPGIFPDWERIHSGWSAGDTANICIGQGDIDVTPLQMAVTTAALANGGNVLWPRLVDRVQSQDPAPGETPAVLPKGRVRDQLGVSANNLQILKDAMRDEVEDAGTGARAVVAGLKICGKTGTAQITNERNQVIDHTTWFISFAPYEQPRYAVVVMVESGSSGGLTCAPIAAKIYEAILQAERMNAVKTGSLAQTN